MVAVLSPDMYYLWHSLNIPTPKDADVKDARFLFKSHLKHKTEMLLPCNSCI